MKRKVVVVVVVLAVVAGGGWLAWSRLEAGAPEVGRVVLYGHVEIRDAQLSFNESQRVVDVLVDEGESVEPDQVLARLQDDRLRDELAAGRADVDAQAEVVRRLRNGTRPQEIAHARAEVAAAEARLANAQRRAARLEDTAAIGATSRQERDDALAALDVAQADLAARREALDLAEEGPRAEEIAEAEARLRGLQADVALVQTRLNDTVLKAPGPGVIRSRLIEVGEMTGPSRPAFVLALRDPKWVRAYLPEPQLGRVRPGAAAGVRSDSFADRAFSGRVGFISPEAEFTPKNVQTTDLRTQLVYEVRIWVDDPDNELRLGMPVTVEIGSASRGAQP